MKKMSIIIPVYNAEKYIKYTIESVLQQNYQNLEIILIDDGSTDKSTDIINEYVEKYSNITLICQENAGAPTARNNGIINAQGDYAIFLDADDTLCENVLEDISIMLDGDIELIIGNFNKIDETGKYICHCGLTNENYVVHEKNILDFCMLDPKPGCKIYNLNVIKQNKLYFDNVKIGQDLNFFLKYISSIKKINFINKDIYNYRIVNNGISRTYNLKILDIENSFKFVHEFYKDKGKTSDYNNYIVWSEYFNYYFQYCKLRFFDEKSDRKKIYKFFNKKRKTLKLNKKNIIFKKYKKIYIISIIRYFIGPLYTTNIYHAIFKKIKGNSHV